MKTQNRVAWTEGMFLKAQHFQQADRWTDSLVRASTRSLSPYPWGFESIELDKAALGIGRIGLTSIAGTLVDGTVFSAPDQCELPAPVTLSEGMTDVTVYLALPMMRPGAPEFGPGTDETSRTARLIREFVDADDNNTDTAFNAPIAIGRHAFCLKTDQDELAGFETLPIAKVVEVRADLNVVIDADMIPPVVSLAANSRLTGFLTEIVGLLRHRASAIAQRAAEPSLRGSAELGDYLMLQALNRAMPMLEHYADQTSQYHPITLYRDLAILAGELATFTSGSRLAQEFSGYEHLDLSGCFEPVVAELRRALSAVLDQTATRIALEDRRHGVKVGMLTDTGLKDDANFVLAVRADIPSETLRRRLPNQIKIGSVERIAELVNVALPGVQVRALPVAPRQLPYRSGNTYFELESEGDIWREVTSSGTIAIHLAAEFPGLELELWGIKS